MGREAEVYAYGDNRVLKLWRDAELGWRSEIEATALRVLQDSDCRVPAPLGEVTEDGRPGLVMERLGGADLLSAIAAPPFPIVTVGRRMAESHVVMHETAAPGGLPDLAGHLRARIIEAPALGAPGRTELRATILRLLESLPTGGQLCHGDLHPGNMVGSVEAPVIIDWADATRGPALADVARTDLLLRFAALPQSLPWRTRVLVAAGRRSLLGVYLRRYRQLRPFDREVLHRWRVVRAGARLVESVSDPEEQRLLGYLQRHVGRHR